MAKVARPDPGKKLTSQQLEFVHALASDPRGDQTAAAVSAGYSVKTATVIASQLLNQPRFAHVQAAYKELVDQRLAKYNVTNARIEAALAMIAFGDRTRISRYIGPKLIVDEFGCAVRDKAGKLTYTKGYVHVTPTDELFEDERFMIEGYVESSKNDGTTDTTIKVLQASKLDAIKALAKCRGMMRNRHEIILDVAIVDARKSLRDKLGVLKARQLANKPKELPAPPATSEAAPPES